MAIVRGVPDGFHTLSPYLICKDATRAIEFYKRAFGATELSRTTGPGGTLMNAQLRIGNSIFMLMEENLEWKARSPQSLNGSPVSIHLYVADADKVFGQAVAAGASVKMPMDDMFWGDRYGSISDPFGHSWDIATRITDLTEAEAKLASDEFFSKMQHA
ncbi:MAG TPA: VOC family protein [Candidatus Eremiobacteraceae bacterium]